MHDVSSALQMVGCPAGVCGELHCSLCGIVRSDCTQQAQSRTGWPFSVLFTAGNFTVKQKKALNCKTASESQVLGQASEGKLM